MRRLVLAALSPLLFTTAWAQTPPIKPGLWSVQTEREVDGRKAPDMGDRLKGLPPEQRKQIEASMKQRGIDISSAGGDIKMCLDKASLDAGRWRSEQAGGCKTDFSAQTGSRWAWKSVCTSPMQSTSSGETVFVSAERYTTKVSSATTVDGKLHSMNMTMTSKWLGSDCGEVQPIKPGMK